MKQGAKNANSYDLLHFKYEIRRNKIHMLICKKRKYQKLKKLIINNGYVRPGGNKRYANDISLIYFSFYNFEFSIICFILLEIKFNQKDKKAN